MTRSEALAKMRQLADRRADIELADQERNHRVWLAAQTVSRRELAAAIVIGGDEPAAEVLSELEAAVIDYRRAVSDGGTP